MRQSIAKTQGEKIWSYGNSLGYCYGYSVEYSKHKLLGKKDKFDYGHINQDIHLA